MSGPQIVNGSCPRPRSGAPPRGVRPAAVCLLLSTLSAAALLPPTASADEIDVTPREVARIQPGTVVGDRAPKGWSNLIIKSRPRVDPASADKVSESTARLAGMLFTAIVADVKANPGTRSQPYHLSGVAIGLGIRLGGRDVVLSSQTQQKLGADLGFLQRSVLSAGEDELARIRCVARSRTMALLDAPGMLLVGGKHRPVVLRYAILVDARTGRLNVLLWAFDPEASAEKPEPLGPMQWLPADKIEDCLLHVDPDEFYFGVPTSRAFAMERLPQGRALPFPQALRALAATAWLTAEQARRLEAQLRGILAARQSRPPTRSLPTHHAPRGGNLSCAIYPCCSCC